MDRPKKEDFKVEYIKGVAEISSVTKQYSRAQDLYIDHLEQLLIQRVGSTCCGCDKCDNGKIWDDVGYSWTSCVCNK